MIKLERNALVWGIVGNLGGGKTLSAVALAVNAIRSGFLVCSNVTLKIDLICEEFAIPWAKPLYQHISLDDPKFDPFQLPCGDPRGSGGERRVVVVLDEVAEWIDQYSSAKDPRISRLWSWLRHSSKRSQDVVIICQRQEYINKVVRSLIARWVWVDDMQLFRVPKIKMRIPFCGGLVMQRTFDRLGQLIDGPSWIKKVNWGRFYDTAECLNSTGASYNAVYEVPPSHVLLSRFAVALYVASLVGLVKVAGGLGGLAASAVRPSEAPAATAADERRTQARSETAKRTLPEAPRPPALTLF